MSMVATATKAVQDPKVQAMIEELSSYGLGVCMPHMHDENAEEEFSQLPKGMVSYEENLKVSFVDASEVANQVPVAWVWDADSESVVVIGACGRGGHT
ncbi:hypothetical protein [Roseofilum casamattae]|uniref:Uncharacterized protein n=1 Tax=Roseofilum casamattae BLCC-M143 TaxID=3022442 RepID=A0ABT7BVR6_9CYAN|nr:hypothetical protein [Roseofilum casamattae]MDJ1182902.1 hypothetical protein [Roseofilum casamattae BLCC-M143]